MPKSLMAALERYGDDGIAVIYDVANAVFIGEDLGAGLRRVQARLKLVHLSDTPREVYRHSAVGEGVVPFAEIPPRARRGRLPRSADARDHRGRPRSGDPRQHRAPGGTRLAARG